jgi:hypothetical protein
VSIPYFSEPKTVWEIVARHSEILDRGLDDSYRIYGSRMPDGSMNYKAYSTLAKQYKDFLQVAQQDFGRVGIDTANHQMERYLYSNFNGGLSNVMAQTRIAASYGLLQILYSTAVEKADYSELPLPENLNLTDVGLFFSLKWQKSILRTSLEQNDSDESGNDWSLAYEQAFWALLYPKWNPGEVGYTIGVVAFSRNYLPR